MEVKNTIVLGASPNPQRYAYKAVEQLNNIGHKVFPIGVKTGEIDHVKILEGQPEIEKVHTVTIYLSPKNQEGYYKYILNLNAKRVIFNPGAENIGLGSLLKNKGVEVLNACTLVMLSTGQF